MTSFILLYLDMKQLVQLIIGFFLILTIMVGCLPGRYYARIDNLPVYKRNQIIDTAKRYIGVPYRYGGTSPRGFDCSGYVMYVYKINGVRIPRELTDQLTSGRRITRHALRPGDLIFFRINRKKWVSHVGIYVGNGTFLHAPQTGKRVGFASINNPYWIRYYVASVSFFR